MGGATLDQRCLLRHFLLPMQTEKDGFGDLPTVTTLKTPFLSLSSLLIFPSGTLETGDPAWLGETAGALDFDPKKVLTKASAERDQVKRRPSPPSSGNSLPIPVLAPTYISPSTQQP